MLAAKCIAIEPELHQRFQRLITVPGIAQTSALQILGELVTLPADRDIRQWVAYAGPDPMQHPSGESVKRRSRLSGDGNRHLRNALYMPALVATRHEPHLRGFYEHLVSGGCEQTGAAGSGTKTPPRHLRDVSHALSVRRNFGLSAPTGKLA